MTNQAGTLSDEELAKQHLAIEAEIAELKSSLKSVKDELISRNLTGIQEALAEKEEPFGSVSVKVSGGKLKFNRKKSVSWDQQGLAALYSQISDDPDEDVRDYIQIEYDVKESAYKNWPTQMRACFEPHRTVKDSPISIEVERDE